MTHNFYTKTHTLSSWRVQITLKRHWWKVPHTTLGIHECPILRARFSVRLEMPKQLTLPIPRKELRVMRGIFSKGPTPFFSRINRRRGNVDFLNDKV